MILIMMGPPGAGKGTQSKIICERLNIIQISTGDILRAAVKSRTNLGVKAKEYLDAGNLVPDEVVIGLIEGRIKQDDCKNGFILDGFPRTTDQAEALDNILQYNNLKIDYVISFLVDNKVLTSRLLDRAKKEGRTDDNLDSIKNRLEVFEKQTLPLIQYYSQSGIAHEISGEGSVEAIAEQVKLTVKR